MSGKLEMRLLGKPEIQWNGLPITDLLPLKGQALLYTLALQRRAMARVELAGLLWGEMPEATARTNLRLTLSRLRKEVGDALQIDRQNVSLDPDALGYVDVAEFSRLAASADADDRRAAEALYRGELLAGFVVRDAPGFEGRLEQFRRAFHDSALDNLLHLIEQARAVESYDEGIEWARRLVTLAPWHEEAHRHLMWLLARSGQRSAALAQFDQCRRSLAGELDIAPSPATLLLAEQIRSGALGDDRAAAAEPHDPFRRTPPFPSDLPQLTDLVGRESELVQIAARLADPACRLLTLIGPGGIGKTRLALVVHRAQATHFRDGVHFVSLAGVTPSTPGEAVDLLVANLANALEFTFAAQQPPRELLIYHLREQTVLLILDNFEQMLDAAGLLTQILQEAPGVKLLVTSRMRLGLVGEWVFDVGGLAWGATPAPGALSVYPALRLFVECAQRIQPGFRPEAEAGAIHQICAFVEGSPLFIELAANWVRLLPCTAIVEKLAQALDLLQADSPIVAPRHQSLGVVLDETWHLLSEDEKRIFACLAIFDGGFTLAAAEAVADARLPILARLMDSSWLKRDQTGRFRVHELLRQYGAARLTEQPALQATICRRHADFYATFIQERYTSLPAPVDDPIWTEVDPEIENLRLAWRWWIEQDAPEATSEYVDGLWRIYRSKGWYPEAVGVLSQALERVAAPALQRVRWQRRLVEATYELGDLESCRRHAEQTLSMVGNPVPTTQQGWGFYLVHQAARQSIHRLLPAAWWNARRAQRTPEAETVAAETAAVVRRLGPVYYQNEMAIPLMAETFLILNLAERVGLEDESTLGLATVGLSCSHIGLSRIAARYMQAAARRIDAIQDVRTKALCLQVIVLYSLGVGNASAAREAVHTFYGLLDHDAAPRLWEENTVLLGLAEGIAGDVPEAIRQMQTVTGLARYRGDTVVEWWRLFAEAEFLLRLERTEDAWVRLEQARRYPAEHAKPADRLRLFAADAYLYLQRGELSMAGQALEQALFWIDQVRMVVPYSFMGYIAAAQVGNMLAARAGREDLAQRTYRHVERFAHIYPVARPALWQMRGQRAGQEGRAATYFQRSLAAATALGMPYEEAQAHALLADALARQGKTEQASAHLASAQILFARLGAPAHLAASGVPG